MLDPHVKTQLKHYLANLQTPVELVKFVDDSPKGKELNSLVEQIAALSENVSISPQSAAGERVPSMLIRSAKTGSEIRFAGVPMGHEFTSLVLALLHSGSHPIKLDEDVIEQVRGLKGEYRFETFISLSCQNCPDVVQVINMMAAINPSITSVMIDGAVYTEEAETRNVMAVPTVFLNGENFSQGRITLSTILQRLDNQSGDRDKGKN
jgi:Alkyl hydroperoxide reductase, large subunit